MERFIKCFADIAMFALEFYSETYHTKTKLEVDPETFKNLRVDCVSLMLCSTNYDYSYILNKNSIIFKFKDFLTNKTFNVKIVNNVKLDKNKNNHIMKRRFF